MRLLTEEIRRILPALRSQDSLGGKAVAHVKFFTPDSSWTWYATEGSPEGAVLNAALARMGQYYHIPVRVSGG